PLGELRVIRQDQQAAGVEVEAADRKEITLAIRQQVVDRGTSMRIAIRSDVAGRLVQKKIRALLTTQRLAVEGHAVALHVDPGVGIANDAAVDAHPSAADPATRLGARAEAGLGENALEGFERSVAGRRFGYVLRHKAMLNETKEPEVGLRMQH